jgi:hypothetical protein
MKDALGHGGVETEERVRVCPNCGREFRITGKLHLGWRQEWSNKFCGRECRVGYSDRQAKALFDSGKPLLTIEFEFVRCEICGKTMEQSGTHFSRVHGIDSRKEMTHMDRAYIYNLPIGSRMVCGKMLEEQRLHGEISNIPESRITRGKQELRGVLGIRRSELRLSERIIAQIPRLVRGAAEAAYRKHVAGCESRECAICGNTFAVKKSRPTRTCSRECGYRLSSKRQKSMGYSGSRRGGTASVLGATRGAGGKFAARNPKPGKVVTIKRRAG